MELAMESSRCGEKPRKHSKNKKKNWRKFSNVKDVERFLEEKRREENLGIPAYEKTDEQLFVVDDNSIGPTDAGNESNVLRSRRKKSLQLRSEANLYPDSLVPPISFPHTRKQRKMKPEMADSYEDSSDSDHDQRSHKETKRDRTRLLNSIRQRKARKIAGHIKTRELHDVWKQESREPLNELEDYFLQVTRNKPVKRPTSARIRPSGIKNIEPPLPGASYNPSFKDHQELLKMAAARVEKAHKKELKYLKRAEMSTMHIREREAVWQEEMQEGIEHILSSDSPSCPPQQDRFEVEDCEREEDIKCFPIRSEDRKTPRQRRKEREAKEKSRHKRDQKLARIRMAEVSRIKSIKRDLVRRELLKQRRQLLRREHKKKDVLRTKRLGRHRFEEPEPDLKLSGEVVGSLRLLEPEGSIARDRYKNLERRNLIEPRGPRLRSRYQKKPKVRWAEKRSVRLDRDIVKWQ